MERVNAAHSRKLARRHVEKPKTGASSGGILHDTSRSSQNMRSQPEPISGSTRSTNQDATSSQVSDLASRASLPSVICCDGSSDAVLNAMVGKVVKESIFPKKQFIILDSELDSNSKLASRCLKELHMEKNQWHLVKNLIRKMLNRKRNNSQLSIRRSLERK